MGALQELQIIHIATHDSIGTGEDGPTHQPIELAALYRAMPNLLYIRPCDSEETVGAFQVAVKADRSSTIISTSRQNLPQYSESKRDAVKYGAYVFRENPDASVTILGVGAEMCFAVETADELSKAGISTRIVSFPSHRLFEQQSREYRRATLRPKDTAVVVVEAYAANGWERYAHASISMKTFGKSLPGKVAYSYFGFNGLEIAEKIMVYLDDLKHERVWKDEFVEL
jgi:dihydroxyacetone synthase